MAKPVRDHPMMVRVMLCAPIESFCEGHLTHLMDAIRAVERGGLSLRAWLDLLIPHGMADGWITVEWRDWHDKGLWIRYRIGVDGKIQIESILWDGMMSERVPECFAEGKGIAAVAALAQASVSYSLADAMRWAVSLRSGERVVLPLRFGAGEGSGAPRDCQVLTVEEILEAAKRRPWAGEG